VPQWLPWRAALDIFKRLDARPWTARAGTELRATGLTIGHLNSTGPASLTPQQREIAELAAAGHSNKQIGERLFLSPRTVGTHLYQVYPKLGVTSRAALRDALAGTDREDSATETGCRDQSFDAIEPDRRLPTVTYVRITNPGPEE
jgi:DNA-binding CsgD family transcriptional regulator